MTAAEIAQALGGMVRAGRGWVCKCPAHDDRTPSLSLRDGEVGVILYCHTGCESRDVIEALRERGLWDDRREPKHRSATLIRPTPKPRSDDDAARSAFACSIWNAAGDPRGTLAERYLKRRDLVLDADLCGRVLRFHPRCPFGEGSNVPALVAAFRPIRDTDDDKPPAAIHRIGLTPDGDKIEKKMLGPVAGCAVKLDADEDVTHGLGVAEGIETGIAVRAAEWRPVWALGNAGAIRTFEPLAGIEALTIFADNDPNGAGQAAARACADRWSQAGHEVTIRTPHGVGTDWRDVLA